MDNFVKILILVALVFVVGYIWGGRDARDTYRDRAIEKGCAYWHPQTKEFVWKADD